MKTLDIQYLLKGVGSSFAAIARTLNLTRSTVAQVANNDAAVIRTSPRVEQMIAALIGRPLHEVFPKRWNTDGTRIKRNWTPARTRFCMARDLANLQKSAKELQETKRAA